MSALTQQERDLVLSCLGVRPRRKRPPRPMKLICVDGKIIADARVIVSPCDPNWYRRPITESESFDGVVQIRRP
jgi:hypothetical protein